MLLTKREVRSWNRLPRQIVMVPSLPEFKNHMGSALRHRVWFSGSPVWSQELHTRILVGAFQLRMILWSYPPWLLWVFFLAKSTCHTWWPGCRWDALNTQWSELQSTAAWPVLKKQSSKAIQFQIWEHSEEKKTQISNMAIPGNFTHLAP